MNRRPSVPLYVVGFALAVGIGMLLAFAQLAWGLTLALGLVAGVLVTAAVLVLELRYRQRPPRRGRRAPAVRRRLGPDATPRRT